MTPSCITNRKVSSRSPYSELDTLAREETSQSSIMSTPKNAMIPPT